jgi:hypothetical protein
MATTIIGNGSITFGDGTVQSTKTPTVVSAFTNDSNYALAPALLAKYAEKDWAIHSMGIDGTSGSGEFRFYTYTVDTNGAAYQSFFANCNCNC